MEREKALEMALSQIEKQYGKGSVMKMSEKGSMAVESVSTGALSLDIALGIGGLPRGRVTEIYGPESSGKSTLAMHVVAEAQRNGGICAYIDAEHAMDPVYAAQIGVDVDELLISQPDTGEQALEIADMLVRSGAIDVIVVDSVAALTPRAEIEGEMGDSHVGLQARLMSQALRKLTANLNKTATICIFINQLREKIGVMFGSPETTPGGRALKFYSSVRLDIRRIESIKDGVEVVGNRTRVKVVKNKCVAAGTTVFDPTTGLTHRIEDIVLGGQGASVVSADKTGRTSVQPIGERFDQGRREVIGLRLGDGTNLRVTPDHKVLTDLGWRPAADLSPGDRLARPRRVGGFGEQEPVTPEEARRLGHRIGDGSVLRRRPSVVPACFFGEDVSRDVVANLLLGLLESDGHITREQARGVRVVYKSTSEQLVHQIHWLLLRFGIWSSSRTHDPSSPSSSTAGGSGAQGAPSTSELCISGIDDVERLARVVPMWGPLGQAITEALDDPAISQRSSQSNYLPHCVTEPVLQYLRHAGIDAVTAARLVGGPAGDPETEIAQVLGASRLRRDRLERLADALDSAFLHEVLAEDLWYDRVVAIDGPELADVYDIEVAEHHNFVADGVVVHNCAPPFKQAEFDIMYGKGISREGSLLDIGVDLGIVKKSGAWYTYEGEQLGQGRENAKAFLNENPEIMVEIQDRVLREVGIGDHEPDGSAQDADGDVVDPDDLPITLD